MVERYTRPQMGDLFTPHSRFDFMLQVELAAARAMNKLGIVPDADLKNILDKAAFEVDRIDEIEKVTRHDVIAFLTNVGEHIGPSARWLHYGMTSSDVLDTATALQLKKAGEMIMAGLLDFKTVLGKKAVEYKDLLTCGRSHGIHAEPTSFGLKFALSYDEAGRNVTRLQAALADIAAGQLSGAVGNFAHLDPAVEELACEYLGLAPAAVSTQVVARDRHAHFLQVLALIGAMCERIALEIRHLQRTEVGEAHEDFSCGQKGSSAMPHKRNPIVSEQLCGQARLLRSYADCSMENIALWHERDISHSSVERVILPDACILADYMLAKATALVQGLVVDRERVQANLDADRGLMFSQAILLALAQKGLSREAAYALVQRASLSCLDGSGTLPELLRREPEFTTHFTPAELDILLSPGRYLKNVGTIYKRLGL